MKNYLVNRLANFGYKSIFVLLAILSLNGITLPEPLAIPLAGYENWVSSGFFENVRPGPMEVRKEILQAAESRFWRSWSPETNASSGYVESPEFVLPDYMLVPVSGFPGERGIEVFLECVATQAKWPVAFTRINNQWAESIFASPRHWCAGKVKLVATSVSKIHWVAVGTPFAVSWHTHFMSTFASKLIEFLLVWGVLVIFLSPFIGLNRKPDGRQKPFFWAIIALACLGYLQFYVGWANASMLPRTSWSLFGFCCCCAHLIFARQNQTISRGDPFRNPLVLWFTLSLMYFAVLNAIDLGGGPWSANARFLPVRWSSDNQIPYWVSEGIYLGNPLSSIPLSPWQVSDRPPLMYGFMLLLRPIVDFVWNEGNLQYHHRFYTDLGIILNCLWVPILYLFSRRITGNDLRSRLIVLLAAFTPFMLFNSIYIWPKLMSGAFGLVALYAALEIKRLNEVSQSFLTYATLAISSALALLSHGGAAFGVLVLGAFIILWRRNMNWLYAGSAAILFLCLLLPWTEWQHTVQPPGNALVKFAFAGTFGFGEESKGLIETILDAYGKIDFKTWYSSKLEGLGELSGFKPECGMGEMLANHDLGGRVRILGFLSPLAALNLTILGGLMAIIACFSSQKSSKYRFFAGKGAMAHLLFIYGIATIAFSWLATWECHIVHTQSYQALLAMALAGGIWMTEKRYFSFPLILAYLCFNGYFWLFDPFITAPRMDHMAAFIMFSFFVYAIAVAWKYGHVLDSHADFGDRRIGE